MNSDWQLIKLGDVAQYINGRAFKPKEWKTKGIPIIRIQNLNKNKDKKSFNYCDFPVEEKYYIDSGDLLFAWSGTPDTSFGAHIWNGGKAVLNQHIFKIEFDEKKINKIFFQLSLNYKVKEFVKKSHGTAGLAHITKGKFEESSILLPPISVQHSIIEKIEKLFSELDAGVVQLKTAQAQLKTYRQSVLKWAFEGRFTNKKVNGELPKGWVKKQIQSVAQINPKIPNKERIDSELEVQFLPMKLVAELSGEIDLSATKQFGLLQKNSYTSFINEDIIFAKVTPCMENGKIAVVNNLKNGIGFGSSEFHVLRCTKDIMNNFLFHFIIQGRFRKEAAREMTGAVGLRRVPRQFLEQYEIPLPSVNEQKQIISEIKTRLSVADEMEKIIEQTLLQSENLKQSILKCAFEGRLVNIN